MPIYVWAEKKSGKKVEILRPFDKYQDQPTQEEAEMSEEEYMAAEWSKELGTGIKVVKGDNWGAGKGRWGSG